jgi:hypothetical protein
MSWSDLLESVSLSNETKYTKEVQLRDKLPEDYKSMKLAIAWLVIFWLGFGFGYLTRFLGA